MVLLTVFFITCNDNDVLVPQETKLIELTLLERNNNINELWLSELVKSEGNCIRYPEGTVANYWKNRGATKLFSQK